MAILRQAFLLASYGRYVWRGVISTQLPHEMRFFAVRKRLTENERRRNVFWADLQVPAVNGVPPQAEGCNGGFNGRLLTFAGFCAACHYCSLFFLIRLGFCTGSSGVAAENHLPRRLSRHGRKPINAPLKCCSTQRKIFSQGCKSGADTTRLLSAASSRAGHCN
jgi:hypothetical protein